MNFIEFSNIFSKIEKNPLPGLESHLKMAGAARIKELQVSKAQLLQARKAAVLAAFYPDAQGETHLLFIKRQGGSGVHASQIAFPGGKAETYDLDLADTALREAHEEVGIHSKAVAFLKPLTPVYIPPSKFLVQPFMGLYAKKSAFVAQETEVHSLLEVPLKEVLSHKAPTTSRLKTSYSTDIEVPSFEFKDEIVWGATAMMLNEIRWLLKEVL